MQRLRMAVATASFGLPLKRSLEVAAQTSATAVQFDVRSEVKPSEFGETARRQLLHSLGEFNLQVASVRFSLSSSLHEPSRVDARIAAIKQAMEFAWQLKARVLTARIGRIPDETDTKEAVRLREILRDLARHGNQVGVTFSISTMGDSAETLLELLNEIDDGPLGIDLDPAGCVMQRQDPVALLRDVHQQVTHIQVRDGIRDVDGAGKEVAVGRGEVDWQELLVVLSDMTYDGWLTAVRNQGDNSANDCANAIAYVRNSMMP